MSRRGKLTDEERVAAVQEYQDGKGSFKAIGDKYGVTAYTVRSLVNRANAGGMDFVKRSRNNKKYTAETKINAVKEYLSGKSSQFEICKKYKITSRIVLQNWISWYNNGKDFKEHTRSERGITMNKGRKTTQEERVEIVAFCIEHGKDYGLAMEKYGVSYQQIYSNPIK